MQSSGASCPSARLLLQALAHAEAQVEAQVLDLVLDLLDLVLVLLDLVLVLTRLAPLLQEQVLLEEDGPAQRVLHLSPSRFVRQSRATRAILD